MNDPNCCLKVSRFFPPAAAAGVSFEGKTKKKQRKTKKKKEKKEARREIRQATLALAQGPSLTTRLRIELKVLGIVYFRDVRPRTRLHLCCPYPPRRRHCHHGKSTISW